MELEVLLVRMGRRNRSQEEDVDDCAKRSMLDAWKDPAILQQLANLLRDSLLDELKAALDRNTEVIQRLETALIEKEKKIIELEEKLEEKTDSLEQDQRRQCLRIFGVPESELEDTDIIAINIAAQIGVELEPRDIDRSHRVGKKGERPRAVIVKLVSYKKRREMFQNKRKLKNSGKTIREDLTQRRHKLLGECISKYGLNNVWTVDGNIFVKNEHEKRIISRSSDIQ